MSRIVVGMSGGVDSSVAALLLKEQGHEVIGVTMKIWDDSLSGGNPDGGCCGLDAVEDARRVAQVLGIPYYVMNFQDVFRRKVIDYFTAAYKAGITPNPCIACNRFVKWESLLERALSIGADRIATGHYARVQQMENGRWALKTARALDGRSKDQTYALYSLTQDQLARTVMPVGDYTKEEIRAIAERAGLPVAHKPDSEEICFVPDGDYAAFIERTTGEADSPGNFVDTDGKVLGQHRGITHYTVGQRKHLGLALGHPVFVKEIRPGTNEVVISENEDLFSRTLTADHICCMGIPAFEGAVPVTAKIRYNHAGAPAVAEMTGPDTMRVTFETPQRAVTPGQALVLYRDGVVLGGGTITGA